MSYFRQPFYCYSNGEHTAILAYHGNEDACTKDATDDDGAIAGGIYIRQHLFDALCLYRTAELLRDQPAWDAAVETAIKHGGGNFNTYDFLEQALGKQEFDDILEERMNQLRERYRRDPEGTTAIRDSIVNRGTHND